MRLGRLAVDRSKSLIDVVSAAESDYLNLLEIIGRPKFSRCGPIGMVKVSVRAPHNLRQKTVSFLLNGKLNAV
jgi:hypothetical protein